MINYFKQAIRTLRKHSFYTVLNIFGLSIGIACCLILYLFISYHVSFDRYHHKASQLYRVVTSLHTDDGAVRYDKGAPMALAAAVQAAVPQVKEQAVLFSNYRDHVFTVAVEKEGNAANRLFAEKGTVAFADRHWFNLFDYQWITGDPHTALEEPNTAVLTSGIAKKYFGNADPVGKTIRLDGQQVVKITGLLKDHPVTTDTKADIFISLSSLQTFYPDMFPNLQTDWGWISNANSIFFQLPVGLKPAVIERAIDALKKESMGDMAKYYQFELLPLTELHFDQRYGGVIPKSLLMMLGIVGFFILIIACVNFINLATAQNARRAKEVSTRKILGSSVAAIFWQFITETFAITLLAVLLGLIGSFISLPVLNDWLHTDLVLKPFANGQLLSALLGLIVFIVLAAGIYPAVLLTRFKPVDALRSRSGTTKQPLLGKGLILFQNIVAQSLIMCTLIILLQNNYLKTANLGFSKEAVVMVPIPNAVKSNLDYLRNQLLTKKGIKDASFCFRPPASEIYKAGSIRIDNRDWESYTALNILGDSRFLSTFGLQLIAGRNLAESDTTREFLVTEDLVKKLGFKSPSQLLGHSVVAGALNDHAGTIVGVVNDIHLHSLRAGIEPLMISSDRESYAYAGIKMDGGDVTNNIAAIKEVWESVYPGNIFEYHFLDEQIGDFYRNEELLNKLTGTFTVVAIVISCVGLLGLISLLTVQRTKEIGIRKIVGASVMNIMLLLSKDFVKLVGLAIVLAGLCCWLIMSNWLQGFAYRISIPWWVFVVGGLGNLVLVILTISFHAGKAAMANPVETLRSE